MRVKAYLATRGVEFDVIEVGSDPQALADVQAMGIHALPVVTIGAQYALGVDLKQVDDLLGLHSDPYLLPTSDLVARVTDLLMAVTRAANQLPATHYEDWVPGGDTQKPMVLLDGTQIFFPDGTPYTPHSTHIGLVRHIVGHGVKFRLLGQDPESEVWSRLEVLAPFGEPDKDLHMSQIVGELGAITNDIQEWWSNKSKKHLERVINSCFGRRTVRWMLYKQTVSLAQHTRQLMSLLRRLEIEPNGPPSDVVYRGLELPAREWD